MTADTLTTFSRSVDQFMVYAEVRLRLRPATLRSYRWVLNKTIDVIGSDVDAKTITEQDLELVLQYWGGCSKTTISNRVSVWHTYFKWLSRQAPKSFDPSSEIDRPGKERPVKRWVAPDEYGRLLAAAETWEDQLILLMLGMTGIRRSEFRGLRWRDVDLEHRRLTVHDGKGGKGRQIPIAAPLVAFLADTAGYEPDDYLVSPKHGEAWSYKRLQILVKKAGLRGPISNHALRRMFARDYLVASPDRIYPLKLIMGHSSIDTTDGYAGDAPLRLAQEGIDLLDELRAARTPSEDPVDGW